MAKGEFIHPGCDTWGIYESKCIDANDAKNIHVADGNTRFVNGSPTFVLNNKRETVCKQEIKANAGQSIYSSMSASTIRSHLAQLQNDGKEVCGTCVSHFYADSEA